VFVDAGARKALREGGKSLLLPGIARCDGEFEAGEVVRICDLDGTEFARGITGFASRDIKARQPRRVEVVHRDNLVVL
jgi:glutamate 5-kinase